LEAPPVASDRLRGSLLFRLIVACLAKSWGFKAGFKSQGLVRRQLNSTY